MACTARDFLEDNMSGIRNVILSGLYVLVVAAPAGADQLPPSVRSCIGEADAARRLACYDREVARLICAGRHVCADDQRCRSAGDSCRARGVLRTCLPPRHLRYRPAI